MQAAIVTIGLLFGLPYMIQLADAGAVWQT